MTTIEDVILQSDAVGAPVRLEYVRGRLKVEASPARERGLHKSRRRLRPGDVSRALSRHSSQCSTSSLRLLPFLAPNAIMVPRASSNQASGRIENLLYPANLSILQAHLDTVRVVSRRRQNVLYDTNRPLARPLILFQDDGDAEPWADIFSVLAVHAENLRNTEC
jgi:hypothetical protein